MRLVATFNFGDLWYADYTVPFMRRYAERIGADFLELKRFPDQQLYGLVHAWFHVEAIRILAAQSYYKTMLLLDADQVVMPGCPDVFALSGGKIAVVQDMGIPEVNDRFRDWCRSHYDEEPLPGPYFNAGMLVVPLEAARRLTSRLGGPCPSGLLADQHFLNLRIRKHEEIVWLPHELNWLAPQFVEASLRKHVHFVTGHRDLLASFVKRISVP